MWPTPSPSCVYEGYSSIHGGGNVGLPQGAHDAIVLFAVPGLSLESTACAVIVSGRPGPQQHHPDRGGPAHEASCGRVDMCRLGESRRIAADSTLHPATLRCSFVPGSAHVRRPTLVFCGRQCFR